MAECFKVAIVTEYFFPVNGGIENHCYNLAKELIKKGVDVEILASKCTLTEKNVLADHEIIDGVVVKRYKNFWGIVPKGYDVIHLHNFNIFPHFWIFLNCLIKKYYGKAPKLVITLHGGFTPWCDEFPAISRLLKRAYHKMLGRFFLNKVVNVIIALTVWEKAQLIKEGINSNKIVVIPNGVEDIAYELPPHKKCEKLEPIRPYVLFLGRISRRKRIDFIIECLKDCNNVNFLIAGPVHETTYYQRLIALVKKYRLNERVKFVGKVLDVEKYKLLDCCLALVLPSSLEFDPIVLKEAIVRGAPVIVSSKGCLPLLIKNYQNGFVVSNKGEFASVVKKLLNNNKKGGKEPISINNMVLSSYKRLSEHWKWVNIVEKILNVYRYSINNCE